MKEIDHSGFLALYSFNILDIFLIAFEVSHSVILPRPANKRTIKMETRYSWFVLGVVFITNFLTLGFAFGSLGLFVQHFNEYFSTDNNISGWIGAVGTAVVLAFGK